MKNLQSYKEFNDINEGFMDYTVSGSDAAADLRYDVEQAIIKALKVGEMEKGNANNSHGTLNVAMILLEIFSKHFDYLPELRNYADKICDKLDKESQKNMKGDNDEERSYWKNCYNIALKLVKTL